MKKIIAVAACAILAAAMLCLVTGCSGSSKLLDSKKLQVATHTGYAGFEMLNDETGEYYGYDIDLAKKLAEDLGVELEIHNVDFDAALSSVQSGKGADIAIAGITITDERKKTMAFSDAYYSDDQAISVVDTAKYTKENYEEALNQEGVKIYVQQGTTGMSYAKEHFPKATITPVDDIVVLFTTLSTGQCDAVVQNAAPTLQYKSQFSNMTIIATIATGEEYGIAINKDNCALLKEINELLAKYAKDGTLEQLQIKNNVKAA